MSERRVRLGVALATVIGGLGLPTAVLATTPEPGAVRVALEVDPARQEGLSPNYVAITALLTDAATGEPVEEEYALMATARLGNEVDDTVFHLPYPFRDNPAAAEPGRYPGVVIVPSGGEWTISVNVFDRFEAESEAIPETLARDEITVNVDAPVLASASEPDSVASVSVDRAELAVRVLHAFLGLTWFGLVGMFAVVGWRKSLLGGELGGLIERNFDRLMVTLVWITGFVWLTGIVNLRGGTAFAPPLSATQAERVFRVPYARPYIYSLYLKIAVSATLTVLIIPITRRARRASRGRNGPDPRLRGRSSSRSAAPRCSSA